MVQHDKYTPCGQHKRAAQRAALRCIFDLVLCDGRNGGHSQDDGTQHDAVEAEELEVVAFDVIHQEADGSQADHKSNHTAHHENGHFGAGHGSAGEDEFDHLEQGGTGPDRDGEEERELGRHRA